MNLTYPPSRSVLSLCWFILITTRWLFVCCASNCSVEVLPVAVSPTNNTGSERDKHTAIFSIRQEAMRVRAKLSFTLLTLKWDTMGFVNPTSVGWGGRLETRNLLIWVPCEVNCSKVEIHSVCKFIKIIIIIFVPRITPFIFYPIYLDLALRQDCINFVLRLFLKRKMLGFVLHLTWMVNPQ